MKNIAPINEAFVLRDGIRPAALHTQNRLMVVSGPQDEKVLWVLASSQRSHCETCHTAVSQSELFWLALPLLSLCRRASMAQARVFLSIQYRRICDAFRRLSLLRP